MLNDRRRQGFSPFGRARADGQPTVVVACNFTDAPQKFAFDLSEISSAR